MNRAGVLCAAAVLFSGCGATSTAASIAKYSLIQAIKIGDTQAQVSRTLGLPHRILEKGLMDDGVTYATWLYNTVGQIPRLLSPPPKKPAAEGEEPQAEIPENLPYIIKFVDNRVVGISRGRPVRVSAQTAAGEETPSDE